MTHCESGRGRVAIINQKPRRRVPRLRHATLPRIKIPFLSFLALLLICTSSLANPVHAASVDLTVDSIWLEKAADPGQAVASVAPGDQFNIVASVKNIGDALGSGYYLDVYYDSDYGRGGPDNIASGEVQTWYVGPLTAQAGTHTTTWIVDPDNQIVELDENNNQKEYTFTIGSETTNTITTTTSTTASNSTITSTTQTATTTNSAGTSTSSSTQSTSTESTSTTTTTVSGAGTVTANSFDFRLSNSGSSSNLGGVTVARGSSGSVTVTVALVNGPAQPVTLSCSGANGPLPSGVSCSSASGTPPFTETLIITVSSSTLPGYYTIKVIGAAGSLTRQTLFILLVT